MHRQIGWNPFICRLFVYCSLDFGKQFFRSAGTFSGLALNNVDMKIKNQNSICIRIRNPIQSNFSLCSALLFIYFAQNSLQFVFGFASVFCQSKNSHVVVQECFPVTCGFCNLKYALDHFCECRIDATCPRPFRCMKVPIWKRTETIEHSDSSTVFIKWNCARGFYLSQCFRQKRARTDFLMIEHFFSLTLLFSGVCRFFRFRWKFDCECQPFIMYTL